MESMNWMNEGLSEANSGFNEDLMLVTVKAGQHGQLKINYQFQNR